MAGTLLQAVVQEAISKVSSAVLTKHEEKAYREHGIERLEMAHTELELAVERSGKFPITDVSLLHRRKILKRALEECSDLLHRSKRQAQEGEDVDRGLTLTHSSFPKRIANAAKSSIAYLLTTNKDDLCCADVRRFEWFADCANKFVRDMESGFSLRYQTFSNPLLRQLLEGKSLRYQRVQGNRLRDLYMWPISLEERGVEAELSYHYEDYKMPEKSFHLRFMLRLSESTDIVGIAFRCLQHLASKFKLAAETALGELSLLLDLRDISHSYAPPWFGIQEAYAQLTKLCRPDPLCCKPSEIISSELSNKFPDQVITIGFQYNASALECNLVGSSKELGRNSQIDWSSLLLNAAFTPHGMGHDLAQHFDMKLYAGEYRDGNIEQEIEMVRSKAINYLILQPELADYITLWQYGHGFALFHVQTSKSQCQLYPKFIGYHRSKTQRISKSENCALHRYVVPSCAK
ncbi:hypothetical protein ACP4OV_011840 [Aristida adscensionis]